MDISLTVTILAVLFAIPMSIAANLLTPRVLSWWGSTSEARRKRQLRKFENKKAEIERQIASLGGSVGSVHALPPGPKVPVLAIAELSRVGINSPADQPGFESNAGFAMFIRNAQTDFETCAFGLKATVTLESVDGKKIDTSEAPWFKTIAGQTSQERFYQEVQLKMLEHAGVVCVLLENGVFYSAEHLDSKRPKSGKKLSFGRWHVLVAVDGGNVSKEFRAGIQLTPNNVAVWFSVGKL
jgi:hypothetical protein